MKCIIAYFLSLILLVGMTSCNRNTEPSLGGSYTPDSTENQTEEPVTMKPSTSQGNILVVYFSATGTTKLLAEYTADILNADLYEIVPQIPYTDADLAYYTDGRADQEQNDPSARPAITGNVSDMDNYNTIILGYPIWHGQAPRIISTFLESYDFSGKTIVPFCTSHSSGIGSSDTNLHSLASNAKWEDGKRFSGNTDKETIAEWIESLGLKNTKSVAEFNLEKGENGKAPTVTSLK